MTNPIGTRRDGHRQIERHLAALIRLAGLPEGAVLSSDDRESLQGVLSYFREAAPRHIADEEECLFPRLRRQRDGLRIHADLDALGPSWLSQGTLLPAAASRVSALAAHRRDLYRHHIAVEENEVFPVAEIILAGSTMQAIGSEMASRRSVPKQTSPGPRATSHLSCD